MISSVQSLFTATLAFFLAAPSTTLAQQLVLDCPVSNYNPSYDMLDNQIIIAAIIRERYRFVIPLNGSNGLVTTIRAANIPAQIVSSDSHFQIAFENRRVTIDRLTAEFQVAWVSFKASHGGGICTKLEQKKF